MKHPHPQVAILALLIIAAICPSFGFAQITHHLTFKESDYSYHVSDDGFTTISSNDPTDRYADGKVPCLPLASKKILLPYSSVIESYTVEYGSTDIIKRDVVLSEALHPTIGSSESTSSDARVNDYTPISFPESNIFSMRSYEWQGMPIAVFDVTPFIYDATDRTLSFINDMVLTINIKQHSPSSKMTESLEEVAAVLKSWVENPQDVNDYVSQVPSVSSTDFLEKIDYILITTEDLRESFQKLVNWKRARGVHAELVTLDRIESWYEGADIQEKIKHCIYDLHLSYGCKYAVLGGDTIPTRKCHIETIDQTTGKKQFHDDAPVDKYYGCFGGDFGWNANGNNLYGEIDDNIDFSESVYISRIPVRTNEDAEAFIDKLIAYEKGRTSNNFSESILTAGAKLKLEHDLFERSDADIMGDKFYKKYVKGWTGKRIRFYDTGNNVSTSQNYELTDKHLQEQLSKNHMFLSMATHGMQTYWIFGSVFKKYRTASAISLITKGSPIITTIACLTNAFDADGDNEPCLSEAFIRGKSNGVIAYWGCSREGWLSFEDPKTCTLGPSMKYEGEFYKHLFDNSIESKNYGKIVSYAVTAIQEQCSENSPYRWVKMCLNPMGDAEMPIFTHKAQQFGEVVLSFTEHCIEIDAGVDNCQISIMSLDDYGKTYFKTFSNVRTVSVEDTPYFYSVSITKPGYAPYIFACRDLTNVVEYGLVDITGESIEFTPTRYYILKLNNNTGNSAPSSFGNINCIVDANTNQLQVEMTDLTSDSKNKVLSIHNIYGNLERSIQILGEEREIITVGNLKKGTYIISLIMDGRNVETIKINL